jgi:A/G-specific adenine glycosylase
MTVAATSGRRKRSEGAAPDDLLAWYDRHRRSLPWRAHPGERPDPYRVWLSEVMLQQTTVKAVAPYFARFLARWPHLHALAQAPLDDVLKLWAGLGYYARARNLHACARVVVERHAGRFPAREAELSALPGVGGYTAAAIAAIAFDASTVPVDGNVERVVTRLFAIEEELPAAKPQVARLAQTLAPERRHGDFAQALMDLGATICTPKTPACVLCPWVRACEARRSSNPESFPRKAPKRQGQLRRGAAYVALRGERVLLRTREAKGLLGGMTEVPTTEWTHDFDVRTGVDLAPRFRTGPLQWRRVPGVVTHVFTHFPLELTVYRAAVPPRTPAPPFARWVPIADLQSEALPNVMRKVIAHALGQRLIRPTAWRPSASSATIDGS